MVLLIIDTQNAIINTELYQRDLFIKNDLTKSEIDSKKAISRLSLIASSFILSLKVWEHTIF